MPSAIKVVYKSEETNLSWQKTIVITSEYAPSTGCCRSRRVDRHRHSTGVKCLVLVLALKFPLQDLNQSRWIIK